MGTLGLKLDRNQYALIHSVELNVKYDLAVGVDPSNKNRIIAGITVWEWEQGQLESS